MISETNLINEFTYDLTHCDNYVDSIQCDNSDTKSDCFAVNDTILNQNGSICCRGLLSCAFGEGLDSSARMDSATSVFSKSSHILCDASASCEHDTLINSNGIIYCSGKDACKYALMYGNNNHNSIYYNSVTIAYCDGELACIETSIKYFKYLFCNGLDSCFLANIIGVSNIYGTVW